MRAGEPVALNFATGELDTRQLRPPDGVILDIGTHVWRCSAGTLHASGSDTALSLSLRVARDRLEAMTLAPRGYEHCRGGGASAGTLGTIPLNIWLNKYAGPAGGQKRGCGDRTAGRANNYPRSRPEGEVV